MQKPSVRDRRARASGAAPARAQSGPCRPRVAAAIALCWAAVLGACGDDGSSPSVTVDTQSQNPAPGPSAAPEPMAPESPGAGDPGAGDPEPAPSPNEGSGDGELPLEPGASDGQAGGDAPSETPTEETPPAEETPPGEEPPEQPTAFAPCPTDGSACRILPLGDSITDGLVGNAPGNTTPSVGGYRVELFRRAVADGHAITFVGRQQNGPTEVDGQPFPRNHEGYSGATINSGMNQIANRLDAALAANPPHIILLHIGTNDMIQQQAAAAAPANLAGLLDQITAGAPDALVVVAQIIPLGFGNAPEAYNAAIPDLVRERAEAGQHLLLVDHFTPIATNPATVAGLVGDNVHPNAAGYAIMADTWYTAIEPFLP